MNKGKYVYAQIVEFLPKWMFDNIVQKYDGVAIFAETRS